MSWGNLQVVSIRVSFVREYEWSLKKEERENICIDQGHEEAKKKGKKKKKRESGGEATTKEHFCAFFSLSFSLLCFSFLFLKDHEAKERQYLMCTAMILFL